MSRPASQAVTPKVCMPTSAVFAPAPPRKFFTASAEAAFQLGSAALYPARASKKPSPMAATTPPRNRATLECAQIRAKYSKMASFVESLAARAITNTL